MCSFNPRRHQPDFRFNKQNYCVLNHIMSHTISECSHQFLKKLFPLYALFPFLPFARALCSCSVAWSSWCSQQSTMGLPAANPISSGIALSQFSAERSLEYRLRRQHSGNTSESVEIRELTTHKSATTWPVRGMPSRWSAALILSSKFLLEQKEMRRDKHCSTFICIYSINYWERFFFGLSLQYTWPQTAFQRLCKYSGGAYIF